MSEGTALRNRTAKLTVAIPTYNRPQALTQNLSGLLPQLTTDCLVRICDNASDTPVGMAIGSVLSKYPEAQVDVVRNRVNVGLSANLARCIELCETEWIWLLGDDDGVLPSAVATVLQAIEADPTAHYINFATELYPNPTYRKTHGVAEFIEAMPSFSNVLFMSTGVYRTECLLRWLKVGYHYGYTGAPHIASLLMSLGDEGLCCYHTERIVDQNAGATGESWSLIGYYLGIGTLLDLPLGAAVRTLLAAKILATLPPVEPLVVQLVLAAENEQGGGSSLVHYDQICSRLYTYDRSIMRTLRRSAYRSLIAFPGFGRRVISIAYRSSRKKSLAADKLQDRLARW